MFIGDLFNKKKITESLRPGESHHFETDPKTGKRVYRGIRGDQHDAPKRDTAGDAQERRDRDTDSMRKHDRRMAEQGVAEGVANVPWNAVVEAILYDQFDTLMDRYGLTFDDIEHIVRQHGFSSTDKVKAKYGQELEEAYDTSDGNREYFDNVQEWAQAVLDFGGEVVKARGVYVAHGWEGEAGEFDPATGEGWLVSKVARMTEDSGQRVKIVSGLDMYIGKTGTLGKMQSHYAKEHPGHVLVNLDHGAGSVILPKSAVKIQGVAEAVDVGQEWVSDTELDQYVPDHLQQKWRELFGYDEDGNPSALWANLTGGYEPDVSDPQHRALMVKVANKWFTAKKIPNVRFFDVKDAVDELEWLVQIGEQGVAEARDGDTNFGSTVTRGSWVVYDGSKVKRFKTHSGAKAYAEKNGGKVASSEFYADKIQKQGVAEEAPPINVPRGWEAKTQADGSTRISKQGSMSSADYKQNMADYKAKNWTPEKMADYGQRMASGQGYTDAERAANYQQQQKSFGQYADQPVQEGEYADDDEYYDQDDRSQELYSGCYVRDEQDPSGEIFQMRGDPTERRVQILDRNGSGWNISPDRLTPVGEGDPDIARYFGKKGVAEQSPYMDTRPDPISSKKADELGDAAKKAFRPDLNPDYYKADKEPVRPQRNWDYSDPDVQPIVKDWMNKNLLDKKPMTYQQDVPEGSKQDQLHKQHQEIRKKRGAPDPDYYKELKTTFDLPDDERWAKTAELKKKYRVAEAGPFSYGAKKPRKGSVADLAAKKRKEQEKNKKPIEPKDQMVGVAKVVTNEEVEKYLDEMHRAGYDIVTEAATLCPECGGPAYEDKMLAEKQDACYHKVKSRYKVWPSAYASGALVRCRKKGAANWGNKSKK